MVFSKIFALLICSVVIASGTSCDNDGNVTAQDVKFLEATDGFFYIHALTNGESVVMFQAMGDFKIQVQYTLINDDCLYETRSYNIENGKIKDHVKVVSTRDEFSISKTLSYMGQKYSFVNGSVSRYNFKAQIKFVINKAGYVFDNDTEDHLFRTIYSEKKKEEVDNQLNVCENGVDPNELSGFEIIVKDNFELTYMNNGSYFYQSYELFNFGRGSYRSGNDGSGSYAFKTSNGFHVVDYYIKRDLFEKTSIYKLSYNVKDDEDLRVYLEANFQDKKEFVYLCFNSTGLSIAEVPDISGGFGGQNHQEFSSGGISDFGFGGQAPSHELSRAGIEMVGDKNTVSE